MLFGETRKEETEIKKEVKLAACQQKMIPFPERLEWKIKDNGKNDLFGTYSTNRLEYKHVDWEEQLRMNKNVYVSKYMGAFNNIKTE